ncbi:MAG: LuxR C-terminal-related transcriptional regulator [Pseudonocardiales bacterium]
MSVRTVTTHISHIFAKLGVSSRAAIAAAWANSPSRAGGAMSNAWDPHSEPVPLGRGADAHNATRVDGRP